MNAEVRSNVFSPKLIIGLLALTLGLLWTLDSLNILESEQYTRWWPMLLIVAGLVRMSDPIAGKISSAILVGIGALLLADNLRFIDLDGRTLISIGIALLGAKLIWDSLGRAGRRAAEGGASPDLRAVAIMAGVKRQMTSAQFRGGDATAVMGGVEIDLRNARIAEGEQAVIDTFAWWGGVEITVPENWRVVGRVFPLMGAFEDKTASGDGPTLVVTGLAIMGGVEVKN